MSLTKAERLELALAEARARRPAGALSLAALELSHPALPEPARLVADRQDLEAVLEDGTPATFKALAFEITPPAHGSRWPEIALSIDGAAHVVERWLEAAMAEEAPILLTFREYVRELAMEGPSRVIGGFEIAVTEAGDLRVTGTAALTGFDRRFGKTYDSEGYPNLVP